MNYYNIKFSGEATVQAASKEAAWKSWLDKLSDNTLALILRPESIEKEEN